MQIASGLPRQISSAYRYRLVAFAIAQRSRQRFRLRRRRPPQPPTAAAEADYLQHHPAHSSPDGLTKAGEAHFADGKTVIFQAVLKKEGIGDSDYQIYTLDLASKSPRMVSTGKRLHPCVLPADGKDHLRLQPPDPTLGQPNRLRKARGYAWDFNEHMDISGRPWFQPEALTDAPATTPKALFARRKFIVHLHARRRPRNLRDERRRNRPAA